MSLLLKSENLQNKEDSKFVFQEETFNCKMAQNRQLYTVTSMESNEKEMVLKWRQAVEAKDRNH